MLSVRLNLEKKHMNKEKGSASDILGHLRTVNMLQKTAIICLVLFVAVLGLLCVYLGSLPKSVPWVIEITEDGNATYYPDAVKLLEDWTPNDATQRYFMIDYVTRMRSVSTDNYKNQENANVVFSRTLDQASRQINEWYTQNNPITRSATEYVQIPSEEISVLAYAPNVWKVTWRETTYRRADGRILSDEQYEGIFYVAFYTPSTERQKIQNPIGMYVTSYDIALQRTLN